MAENFEKIEKIFDENDVVRITIGELEQLINLCVIVDRIENPKDVDYGKYITKFLTKRNEQNKN